MVFLWTYSWLRGRLVREYIWLEVTERNEFSAEWPTPVPALQTSPQSVALAGPCDAIIIQTVILPISVTITYHFSVLGIIKSLQERKQLYFYRIRLNQQEQVFVLSVQTALTLVELLRLVEVDSGNERYVAGLFLSQSPVHGQREIQHRLKKTSSQLYIYTNGPH